METIEMKEPKRPWRERVPRMSGWMIVTAVLFAGICWIAPQQIQVVTYKVLLLTFAVVISYHADRAIFMRVRDRLGPDMPRDIFAAARLLSRALIFLGCVLGLTLGL